MKRRERTKDGPGKKKRDWFGWRLNLILSGLILLAGLVLARAFVLQVIESERLAALARQEYHQTITLLPSRGVIYDRNRIELALSVQVDSVYARPNQIRHKAQTAARLAPILSEKNQSILKALNRPEPFVWLKRQVGPEVAKAVRALKVEGLGVVPENRRFYPHRHLAAHLLGFAGLDAQGLEGLEKGYDRFLKGRVSRVTRMRDASGRPIYDQRAGGDEFNDGHDLVLTIDQRLQYVVERTLEQAVARHQAKGGLAVVMAPQTGEMLAASVLPDFNPNVFGRYAPEVWRNRIVTDPFEPGSTLKIVTAAAALEEGVAAPETIIDCQAGALSVGRRTIRDVHPHGRLNLCEVVAFSSNVGAAKLGLALGPKAFHRHLARFGFGRLSGIDLPGESAGLLRPPGDWRQIDTASASFGYGVAVTAVQLIAAYAAVANQGVLMRPFVVREIIDARGEVVRRFEPSKRGRAMRPHTARTLTSMLEKVVAPGGTGARAAVPGYRVAGKTGTVQKIDPASGTYSEKNHLALFVGFVPAEEPALTILVIIDEPQDSFYGGVVAAPVFAAIAQQALPLLGVSPSEDQNQLRAAAPLKTSVTKPVPASMEAEIARDLRSKRMPRLVGLSLRQALGVLSAVGLTPIIEGHGYVAEQDPPPGKGLAGLKFCRLKLKAEAS